MWNHQTRSFTTLAVRRSKTKKVELYTWKEKTVRFLRQWRHVSVSKAWCKRHEVCQWLHINIISALREAFNHLITWEVHEHSFPEMSFRQVGKFATSAFSQRYFSLVRAFSANAGPRERIWNCSKEVPGEIHLECLKDMLVDGDIQLFDVRETDEVASTGKIPLSINIPCKFLFCLASLSAGKHHNNSSGVDKTFLSTSSCRNIRELSELRTTTGSEQVSYLPCLHTTTFILLLKYFSLV